MSKKSKVKKQFSAVMLILGVVLTLYVISFIVPLIWCLLSSVKDKFEFKLNIFGLPKEWLFSNYPTVLQKFFVEIKMGGTSRNVYVLEMLGNSILYALGCALVQTTVQFVMAYVSTRYKKEVSE